MSRRNVYYHFYKNLPPAEIRFGKVRSSKVSSYKTTAEEYLYKKIKPRIQTNTCIATYRLNRLGNWSCDLKANERPKNCMWNGHQTHTHPDIGLYNWPSPEDHTDSVSRVGSRSITHGQIDISRKGNHGTPIECLLF